VKLRDLSWAIAGPSIGRTMADFGATVIRVETADHPDVARVSGYEPDRVGALLASGALDLQHHPRGTASGTEARSPAESGLTSSLR
jgi:crotonobetainyl-CoA:carnitine CoA-transferase CaiB-like acyl-CoA transferase